LLEELYPHLQKLQRRTKKSKGPKITLMDSLYSPFNINLITAIFQLPLDSLIIRDYYLLKGSVSDAEKML